GGLGRIELVAGHTVQMYRGSVVPLVRGLLLAVTLAQLRVLDVPQGPASAVPQLLTRAEVQSMVEVELARIAGHSHALPLAGRTDAEPLVGSGEVTRVGKSLCHPLAVRGEVGVAACAGTIGHSAQGGVFATVVVMTTGATADFFFFLHARVMGWAEVAAPAQRVGRSGIDRHDVQPPQQVQAVVARSRPEGVLVASRTFVRPGGMGG